jgi:hypothetical protein
MLRINGSLQYDVLAPMSSTERMPNRKKMESMITTVLATGTTDLDTETRTWRISLDLLMMVSGLKARNVFAREMRFELEARSLPSGFASKMVSMMKSMKEITAKKRSKTFQVLLKKSLRPIAYHLEGGGDHSRIHRG